MEWACSHGAALSVAFHHTWQLFIKYLSGDKEQAYFWFVIIGAALLNEKNGTVNKKSNLS